jgi:hypothetical protein
MKRDKRLQFHLFLKSWGHSPETGQKKRLQTVFWGQNGYRRIFYNMCRGKGDKKEENKKTVLFKKQKKWWQKQKKIRKIPKGTFCRVFQERVRFC